MKRFTIALSVMAVMGLAACANGGTWTPQSAGRTAGSATVENPAHGATGSKADKAFNHAMHK